MTNKNTIIDYPDRQKFEIKYQVYGIAAGRTKTEALRVSPPEWGKEKAARLQKSDGFSFYKLAGSYPCPDPGTPQLSMPIYRKGLNPIVDGFYPKFAEEWHQNSAVQPGTFMVCLMRRGRVTTDRVIRSSENPVAWGVITEINDDTITLHANLTSIRRPDKW